MAKDALTTYRAKRDFSKTAEPKGGTAAGRARKAKGPRYLIQKHDATRLHYDFRLEHKGVLLSWAVTRGPSLDPHDKRLAVHVEDHPIEYGDFEGTIPQGEYGGGTVMLWDEGSWEPVGDVDEGLRKGDFKFILHGQRLQGKFVLVRMRPRPGENTRRENWLLIKERDAFVEAGTGKTILEREMTSVRSGRSMEEIAAGNLEWTRKGARKRPKGEAAPRAKGELVIIGGRDATRPKPAAATPAKAALKLPRFIEPQLATLVDAVPTGADWLHEIKIDGYRALVATDGRKCAVYTRKGLDWADKFPEVAKAATALPVRSALIDGELAVADDKGHTDFGDLQEAISAGGRGITYFAFDLLELDGVDLRMLPLTERKARLAELLKDAGNPLAYCDHIAGSGEKMFEQACSLDLEGIISKRADAPYRSGRASGWLKIKCEMTDEFVIIGWRPSDVKGRSLSSLLLGQYDKARKKLLYRGRVGSGYGEEALTMLGRELKKRAVDKPPLEGIPRDILRDAHFVKPELVADIAFRGWTHDNLVRQAAFRGLRADKAPKDVVKETIKPVAQAEEAAKKLPKAKGNGVKQPPSSRRAPDARAAAAKSSTPSGTRLSAAAIKSNPGDGAIEFGGVRITHPDKVLFPGQGVTKRVLLDYYAGIAPHILPHIAERPLSLVRAPDGRGGETFFQKHASRGFPNAFKPVTIKGFSGPDQFIYIDDERGLFAAVQMGVLELHIWGSHIGTLEKPDRIVFDFDPDEDIGFEAVRHASFEMRDRLKKLGLESFPMATGGKGIHVVVPLTPKHEWDNVKAFAEAMARTMSADDPGRYLAEMSKARRKGRIFIDYLRNGRGATAICPFSTRAKPGATVAWPISWTALAKLDNAHPASIETALSILKKQRKDPWDGYADIDQVLPLERLTGG